MNMVSCYNRFLSKPVAWLVNIIYPLAAIIITMLKKENIIFSKIPNHIFCVMITIMTMCAEIMLDGWILGGAYRKDTYNLELIKSSSKGRRFWKKILIWDAIRRVGTFFILSSLAFVTLCSDVSGEVKEYYLLFFSVTALLTFISAFVCRFFQSPFANMMCTYIGATVNIFLINLLSKANNLLVISFVVIFFALVVVGVNVVTGIKVFERSYKDE